MPVYPRDGFMPTASALVVASDASPALIAAAMEAKDRLGDLIQICDGIDDLAKIQAAISSATWGKILLSAGTYNLADEIALPTGQYSQLPGIILAGMGMGTIINYTPATGYAIRLEGTDDGATCSNHLLEDLRIEAPNTTDGGVLFSGGCFNRLHNVGFRNIPNGKSIAAQDHPVSGASSLMNVFDRVIIWRTKYGLYGHGQWLVKNSQIICNQAGNEDAIHLITGGFLWMSDTQLEAQSGKDALYLASPYSFHRNIYVNNGNITLDGSFHTFIDCNMPFPSYTTGTRLKIVGERGFSRHGSNIDSFYIPEYLKPLIVEAADGRISGGVLVADGTASGGYVRQNADPNATGDVIEAYFDDANNYGFLPRGKYLLEIRLKDTNQVANQPRIFVHNTTDGVYPLMEDLTLTASWLTYCFVFTIDSNDDNDDLRIGVRKMNDNNNTISCDYIRVTYLGSEWGRHYFGGREFLFLPDAGVLPAAGSRFRGVIAFQPGAGGVADTLQMCMKSATDTYSWRTIVTG